MDQGALRNIEQIQETENGSSTPKGMAFALLALGGACVVFATLALTGHKTQPQVKIDPLGDLVAQRSRPAGGTKPTDLSARDVTFPGILSDGEHPTTALAAVRANVAAPAVSPAELAAPVVVVPVAPPPAGDKLPVVALPAQNVLNASPVLTRPRDALTLAATDSAQVNVAGAPSAAAGHDGGYQLQVSSFRSQTEANQFSDQLRARGHKSYVLEAHVSGRGTWYRVRVGPFKTQHEAAGYRTSFESREHVVPFIVPPVGK